MRKRIRNMFSSHGGMTVREAAKVIKRLGGTSTPVRRTGETRFTHPRMDRSCRFNGRETDAPGHLVVWLKRIPRC